VATLSQEKILHHPPKASPSVAVFTVTSALSAVAAATVVGEMSCPVQEKSAMALAHRCALDRHDKKQDEYSADT